MASTMTIAFLPLAFKDKGKMNTKTKKKFEVHNEDQEPFTIVETGRVLETLQALMGGPVKAPAYTRRSDHVFRLRQKGVVIETELRKQKEDGAERYGVYHLKSKVVPVVEVAA